jgi:two-component system CheB/CheR fusion protein
MLIYFQPATQERVLALFHFALRRGGCLFLGSSEGLGGVENGFATLNPRQKIYRKTADSLIAPPEIRAMPSARTLRTVATSLAGSLPSTITVSRALLQAYDYLLKQAMPTSFIVAENGEIVQYFAESSRFLLPPEGRSHDNLFNRTEGDLRLALSTIIPKAIKSGQPAQAHGVRQNGPGGEQVLDLRVTPIPDDRHGISLVHVEILNPREAPVPLPPEELRHAAENFQPSHALGHRVQDLELELHTTKENLQSTVEELQTSNEELQATNEELLAANEELQSTNEELHSVNEELYTVNAEFERKNHELKTIGEDLNNLLASTDIGTLFLDRHLRIRRFTPAIARIFHLLPQDISRPIDHLAYQLDGEIDLMQRLRDVLATGTPLEREIRTRDGNWLFQRLRPFRTTEDKIDGVVMTFTDISGVKSIQDKLNLAMEFSRMVWWEWDLNQQVLNTHTGGQSIFGYAGSMITTTSAEWYNLIHADDLERVKQSLENCLRGDVARWECQHRFLTRDGQWRWVVNKGKIAARDASGRPVRMLGTTQDIHERFLAEQEIRKLNLALERSPVMVMMTDLEGKIEYVNQQFTDVTGYSAGEVIGKNPRILKSTDQAESTFREMWSTLKRGETWHGELCNRRRDGSTYWERATMAPLKDADGRVNHYVALKEEITARQSADDEGRRMEEQLSQVQKMETLGALAGGIAHDFNNILTAIIGHTDLAAELAPPPHPAAECMLQVRQASRRASDLVQRILSFSHRGPSDRTKINLGYLVAEVIPLLRASIPSTIKVDLSIASNDLTVHANATDIQQIVLNLGGNAAYAMREHGGFLRVSVDPYKLERPLRATAGTLGAGDYLRLRVHDTGTGISPSVMARMFEPFFTTKPSGEGTGLGLSIVLGIVLAHNGAIDVRSEPGAGTAFDIFLPAVAPDPVADLAKDSLKATGRGERIAFGDDEPAITQVAQSGLSMRGYSPTTFNSAAELLDHLQADGDPFDLIITDHTMPGKTGLELIRQLRESGLRTPIIILSGNARYVSKEDLSGLGNVQFMPKPFDLSALHERIAVALAEAR